MALTVRMLSVESGVRRRGIDSLPFVCSSIYGFFHFLVQPRRVGGHVFLFVVVSPSLGIFPGSYWLSLTGVRHWDGCQGRRCCGDSGFGRSVFRAFVVGYLSCFRFLVVCLEVVAPVLWGGGRLVSVSWLGHSLVPPTLRRLQFVVYVVSLLGVVVYLYLLLLGVVFPWSGFACCDVWRLRPHHFLYSEISFLAVFLVSLSSPLGGFRLFDLARLCSGGGACCLNLVA